MGVYLLLCREEWERLSPSQRADRRVRVLVGTAVSGGTLRGLLRDAVRLFGAKHILLDVQRLRMEFPLPCPSGEGRSLSERELDALRRASGTPVFFSPELGAKYFLCPGDRPRFILFDDAETVSYKLRLAGELGIDDAALLYPDACGALPPC